MRFGGLRSSVGFFRGFSIDTSFVLFFLGLDLGGSIRSIGFESLLTVLTIAMVAVLPFYLPSTIERMSFGKWLIGRGLICLLGTGLGILIAPSIGSLLPESFRLLPLTLLIVAAAASCFIQFYGLMRLRLAK